ncbi:MAG TPA: two-component regulator propeller domain-containing protein [Pyrinomonadaceae bacterium]|nr:two-component regulator propeller domain-containing protein [Pyrinomonadaceae bacterium]
MATPRGRRRRVIPFGVAVVCLLIGSCLPASALNPDLDVSQYAHTSWKLRDGFANSLISSIAQTPDGYLWVGTEFGLYRFDGVRNVLWQPPVHQQLPSNWIFALHVSRDGTLWIGTEKGLASWKDGKLTQYQELAGRYIFKVLEDREGVIWVSGGAVPVGKLCAIRTGSVQCFGEDGSLGRAVFNLYEDSKGNLWAGVKDGVWRWKPGPPKFYPLAGEPDGIQCLGEDNDGTLLVGWNSGIHRFIDGKTTTYQIPNRVGPIRGRRMLRDRQGGLFIGTFNEGVVRVNNGTSSSFGLSDGLSGELINSLLEDREGNIWLATPGGIDRFRQFAIPTFSVRQGLTSPRVQSVLADRDGGLWIATANGLNRWGPGSNEPDSSQNWDQKNNLRSNSLFQDDTGRIWVTTPFGFGHLENGRFISISKVPGSVTGMAQDNSGNLWVANEQVGLFQVFRGAVVQQIPWSNLGRTDHASILEADPLGGGVWVGFFLGGIVHLKEGRVTETYDVAKGLADSRVSDLQFDKSGSLWVATEGGLSRLKNGRIATLNSKNGLPCDAVHWLREDNAGAMWLYTACGLMKIARSEFDAWATAADQDINAKATFHPTIFDSADGVSNLASGAHFFPQVAKSTDGRLWFSAGDGLYLIDPSHLNFNKVAPPVHIERLVGDRTTYDATTVQTEPLRLPSLIRDLQIDYTALSLVAPEKILFRYKLEGRDRDWQEVTNRRQVFYNDLPPGNYRFRVMASNNNGIWNEAGTYLDFTIAPAYYQTAWFRIGAVILVLFILGALYQMRLRQTARQVHGRMEERLEERERIARDLHDTLLQSVQGLILKFHAVSKQMPRDTPAYNALEKTLDHADEVLAEGRDRIRNLRVKSTSLNDLPASFRSVAEETSQGRKAVFTIVVEGRVRNLHPVVVEECYSIGREAIINALTHSDSNQVEAQIIYDSRHFCVRVRDDGRGIDPRVLEAGGRSGHWGLQGMNERAQKIGGQLKFWSRQDTGTEVELTVPAATAYQDSTDKSKSFWFGRFSDAGKKPGN